MPPFLSQFPPMPHFLQDLSHAACFQASTDQFCAMTAVMIKLDNHLFLTLDGAAQRMAWDHHLALGHEAGQEQCELLNQWVWEQGYLW